MRGFVALLALTVVAACTRGAQAPPKRVELKRLTGSTFELIPSPGQHAHCLAYTMTGTGLIRQLTMSRTNMTFDCPAGAAIGGHPFRVPVEEGPVKVLVVQSSKPVNAASVSQQLLELPDREQLSVMDLRLPGQATLDVLEFSPHADEPAEVGGVIGPDAGAP